VGAIGRSDPDVSQWSENPNSLRPVVSDSSGGVGLVCGMKRGILRSTYSRQYERLFGRQPTCLRPSEKSINWS
jgi:hypothetical protein